MSGLLSGAPTAVNPLRQLTIDQLRQRTSLKWREYPDDVLPLWVAEMDVPARRAGRAGDHRRRRARRHRLPRRHGVRRGAGRLRRAAVGLGRACRGAHRAGARRHARRRRGAASWSPSPGTRWSSTPRSTRRSTSSSAHADRRIVEAPLGADLRIDLDALEEAFRRARAGGRPAAYLLCSPHNPTGVVHTRGRVDRRRRAGRAARRAGGRRRDPRSAGGCGERASCRTSRCPARRTACR